MPKVQGKKSGAVAARPKAAVRKAAPVKGAKKPAPVKAKAKAAPKPAPKKVAKPAAKSAKAKTKPAKAAAKPAPKAKAATKAVVKPPKPSERGGRSAKAAAKASAKPAAKPAAKNLKVVPRPAAAPAKPAAKAAAGKPAAAKATPAKPTVAKATPVKPAVAAKPAPANADAPAAVKPAALAARPAAPPVRKPAAAEKKPRARRSRLRITSDGAPVAAWLNIGEKPRPSSFIPAPPRAEAPSLIAAPPASSDRLIREDDLVSHDTSTRNYPVRVDIELAGGRVYVGINPEYLTIRPGEGIEWDFRHLNGADVLVEEVVIEFPKPGPFAKAVFKSHKPGSARPHRDFSGPAGDASRGSRIQYTIRCLNVFRTDIGSAKPWLVVG